MRKIRVLALDGGGIRGLLTARILGRLCREPELATVFDSVDLIAGTSSGGLIALAMAHGLGGRSMAETINRLGQIFDRGAETFGRRRRLGPLLVAKYGTDARANAFKRLVTEKTTLGDLPRKVLISAFDLDNEAEQDGEPSSRKWKPKLFHNLDGECSDRDELVWKVALYTTALPVYFPSVDGYIDGGVYANNPSMCALAQLFDRRYATPPPSMHDVLMLSIGAGLNLQFLPHAVNNWGVAWWGKKLVDLTVDSSVGIADYQCAHLLGPENYHRVAPELPASLNVGSDDVKKVDDLNEFFERFDEALQLDATIAWLRRYWVDRTRAAAVPSRKERTSKHILTNTELTCLAPIRSGFVTTFETRTYATRLRIVVGILHALRLAAREAHAVRTVSDIVDAIRSIHSFHFAIVNERQLLLSVTFAGAWEPYMRIIWRDLGPLMDLVLCNCEGYEESSSDKGFDRFVGFIRRVQVESEFFYPASGLSVDDHRYLEMVAREVRRGGAGLDRQLASLVVGNPSDEVRRAAANNREEAVDQALMLLRIMHGLRDLYPDAVGDGVYLARAARTLLKGTPLRARIRRLLRTRQDLTPELAWLHRILENEREERHNRSRRASRPRTRGPGDEIQGGILRAYKRRIGEKPHPVTHGCLLLARITEPKEARQFLRTWTETTLTRHIEPPKNPDFSNGRRVNYNIAFTLSGLQRLEVPESELAHFPKEFREGMAARAGLLGDIRSNHPDRWVLPEWNVEPPDGEPPWVPGVRLSTVDLVVTLSVAEPDASEEWRDGGHPLFAPAEEFIREARRCGIRVLSRQLMRNFLKAVAGRMRTQDHFGLADGISQPRPHGSGPDGVRLGEVLLGYENDRGDPDFPSDGEAASVSHPLAVRGSLLDNGTFLVVRKLEQNVQAWQSLEVPVREKMLGRTHDGRPLADPARNGGPKLNEFHYRLDPGGDLCPLSSHVRRANPRAPLGVDGNGRKIPVPRILRRGMSYGPRLDAGTDVEPGVPPSSVPEPALSFDSDSADAPQVERGLMFMAYNASIAEQFEVIQRWISGGNSTGQFSGDRDPLAGVPDPAEPHTFRYPDVHAPGGVRRITLPDEPLVTLRWGLYLFVPSIAAMNRICTEQEADTKRALAVRVMNGEDTIQRLQTADDWAAVYEDVTAVHSGATEAVSAAIRENHGGLQRTPYGVIVASERLVMRVLQDDRLFSVSEYRNRMARSIGQIYLGLDAGTEYEALARGPNAAIQHIDAANAFIAAWKETLGVMVRMQDEHSRIASRPTRASSVPELAPALAHDSSAYAARSIPSPNEFTEPAPVLFSREELADRTLAALSRTWLDIPDGEFVLAGGRPTDEAPKPRCPFHTLAPSRYLFSSPRPRLAVTKLGTKLGDELRQGVRSFVEHHRKGWRTSLSGPLSRAVFEALGGDSDAIASNLIGVMEGFLPTVYGTFLKVTHLWSDEDSGSSLHLNHVGARETLWRLQQELLERPDDRDRPSRATIGGTTGAYERARRVLEKPLMKAMMHGPVPDLLYRTARGEVDLGGLRIRAGERVILSIASAARDLLDRKDVSVAPVFGGLRSEPDHPTHACPGYGMGMGVLLGMLAGMLQAGPLSPGPHPYMTLGDQRAAVTRRTDRRF